jgi:FkbM family methyltransferase
MRVWPDFRFPQGESILAWGAQVVLDGEYKIERLTFEKLGRPPIILDGGGNCGSFSRWAQMEYPDCKIIAYEPHPKNATLFRYNNPNVELHEAALVGANETRKEVILFDGIDGGEDGSGMASLECRGGQKRGTQFTVQAVRADKLPPCDYLKLDIEGLERVVLQGYKHLKTVATVALEFHYRSDQFYIGAHLEKLGFHCVDQKVEHQRDYFGRHSGVLKFLRPEFMVECRECHAEDGRRRGYRRADGMVECRECDAVFTLTEALTPKAK